MTDQKVRWESSEAGKAYYKAYQQKWHEQRKSDPEWVAARQKQQREAQRKFRKENAELIKARKKAWREAQKAKDPEWVRRESRKRMADEKRHFALYPEKAKRHQKRRNLKARFNLSIKEFDRMLAAQKGLCAICGQPERAKLNGIVKHLSVDHDHSTGQIRDLLCNACNRAIGLMQENQEALIRAADYLKRHSSEVVQLVPPSTS